MPMRFGNLSPKKASSKKKVSIPEFLVLLLPALLFFVSPKRVKFCLTKVPVMPEKNPEG